MKYLEHAKLCARLRLLEETHLLTVGEVALRLRQSERTVRDKIAAGALPAIRIGDGPRAPLRIPAGELEEWLALSHVTPADELYRDIGSDLPGRDPAERRETQTRGSRLSPARAGAPNDVKEEAHDRP